MLVPDTPCVLDPNFAVPPQHHVVRVVAVIQPPPAQSKLPLLSSTYVVNVSSSGYTLCPGGNFCCPTTATCILNSQICATTTDPPKTLVVQNAVATVAPTPGLSLGDKIALGVGIGVGVPTFLVTLAMCLQGAG